MAFRKGMEVGEGEGMHLVGMVGRKRMMGMGEDKQVFLKAFWLWLA